MPPIAHLESGLMDRWRDTVQRQHAPVQDTRSDDALVLFRLSRTVHRAYRGTRLDGESGAVVARDDASKWRGRIAG
jgi:hypothetical protein